MKPVHLSQKTDRYDYLNPFITTQILEMRNFWRTVGTKITH